MENIDFSTSFLVGNTPDEAFNAIANVRGWWSQNIEGGTSALHDEFKYSARDLHHCRMKLTEVQPGKKMVWQVLDNYFKFTEDKTEWIGNTIIFDITEKEGQTEVRFTQKGLTPADECYDICSSAWTGYLHESLRPLIETGKGFPNEKEGAVMPA